MSASSMPRKSTPYVVPALPLALRLRQRKSPPERPGPTFLFDAISVEFP